MSELDDDITRGCLKNGEPLEAKWGSGWWSARAEQQEPPTDMDIWNDLQRKNDQLRSENKRLKKALLKISTFGIEYCSYDPLIYEVREFAKKELEGEK